MDNENEFNYTPNNSFKKTKPEKNPNGFGKNVFIPFISGILGASLVVGTCFGIPAVKSKIINSNSSGVIATSTPRTYANTLIDLSDYSTTAVAVAQKVLPSVVGITVKYSVNSFWGASEAKATGSGIIISDDGYIVTNNHVISEESASSYYQVTEATGIEVYLYGDTTPYKAEVVGSDSYSDLAVLKIEKEDLPCAELGDSDDILIGEFVMAIGNPLGMDSSVTCGIVSALDREITDADGKVYTVIQTDAAINSGNSGGALVNAKGQVIGINTLKLSGTGIEGMGFSIPINSTTKVISQLTEYGEVIRPYIGIAGSSVKDSVSEIVINQYKLPLGIYVSTVEKESPAEEAGIEVGDIITAIDGTEVGSVPELNKIKNTHEIGDEVTLKVTRNAKEMDIKVTLGAPKEETEEEKKKETLQQQNNNIQQYNGSIFDMFR